MYKYTEHLARFEVITKVINFLIFQIVILII